MEALLKIGPTETFTEVMEDILNNLYDISYIPTNKTVDNSCIKAVQEEIQNIILETNLNTNKVYELLSAKHENDEKLRIFVSLLEKKKSELLHLMLVHYNCAFGETLNTFDWKLKLVCGTSELKIYSYPLLQLALYSTNVNHKPQERLYEINKDTLLRLIGTLEDIVKDSNTT